MHKTSRVTAQQAGRVDRVVQHLTALPRRQIRGLFDQGCVSVNGQLCRQTHTRVKDGDTVEVRFHAQQRYLEKSRPRQDPHFTVVYEDEHLIVVDKAAGILTVPTVEREQHTLLARVSMYVTRGRSRDQAFACHRLDRGVSGLLVVGKTWQIARVLRDQFKARKPLRLYYAIVAGQLAEKQGTFRTHLATAGNLDRYSIKQPRCDQGQNAITHYRVKQVLEGATFVQVQLETGRRNQIRVHFAEVSHPVLGDQRYEPELARHPLWKVRRLALHAAVLGFDHPMTGPPMRFDSPLPAAMQRLIRQASRR